jgi:hypothetical protein
MFVLVMGIVFDMISEKLNRFGEICVQCPIFANDMCFLTGIGPLSKTDIVRSASVRRLTPFSAWYRRFIVFRI